MLILTLFLSFLIFRVRGGELLFARVPSSIKLQDEATIKQSLLPEIFLATLGFTTQEDLKWKGIKIIDPFNFAEALVVLNLNGIDSLEDNAVKRYELNNDESDQETWRRIKFKLSERYPIENLTMEYINLPSNEIENEIGTSIDKIINLANEYSKKIQKHSEIPHLYWFNVKSNHKASKDTKDLILKAFLDLSKEFSSAYKGSALVAAIVSDTSHLRKTRSVQGEKLENSNMLRELKSNVYDPDFPVIFNIILWFTIALVFSLIAISVFIASMDPGRDSIIYRMTSNRMKKDS